jgi:hypothetical protein
VVESLTLSEKGFRAVLGLLFPFGFWRLSSTQTMDDGSTMDGEKAKPQDE